MTILITIFSIMGAFFIALLYLSITFFKGINEFKVKYKQYIFGFIKEYSQTWDVSCLSYNLSDALYRIMNTPDGKYAQNKFREFGKLLNVTSDVEIQDYKTGSDGKSGLFNFNARFEYTYASVTIGLFVHSSGLLNIDYIAIEPISDFQKKATEERFLDRKTSTSNNVVDIRQRKK